MKKFLLTLTLITFSTIGFSQRKTQQERQAELNQRKAKLEKPMKFKKAPKDLCKLDHKCKLQYKYDEFDKYYLYKIPVNNNDNLVKGSLSYKNYSLQKIKNDNGEEIILMTFYRLHEQCRTQDSYISLIFEDDQVVKIPTFFKSIDCGITTITVNITEYIEDFLSKDIRKIRYSLERNQDYTFTTNKKTKQRLKDNLKCLKSI